MAAHVLRLRFDLLIGALRGRPRDVARNVAGLAALTLLVVAICTGTVRLSAAGTDVAAVVTILAGAGIALGFLLAPLVAGWDDPLDPRRFIVFGAETPRLIASLLPASLISVSAFSLIAVSACVAIMWAEHSVPPALGALGGALFALTCLLLSKAAMALAALALRPRQSRELTGLFVIAILIVVVPAGVFLAALQWEGSIPSQLVEAAGVLSSTPLGASLAIPARVAAGASPAAHIAIALATVIGLAVLWAWLTRQLVSTTDRPASGRARRGLGWFNVTPATATGAIAARSLTYWLQDSRYLANVIIVPVAGLLAAVPLLVVGVPVPIVALVPVPIMALFFGWIAHNDLAYDSTALWMHLASAVRGTADRLGRLAPVLLVAVPILAVSVPVAIWLHGRWALLPAMAGVCASLFLCGLGLSSISSAAAPYPASRPGDGPFQQPQRTGGGLAQGVVLVGAVALSAPVLWWAWLSLSHSTSWAWTALWGGFSIGMGVLIVGIFIGGAVFRRRGSRLMEFAESS
ncbi:hypothetical protein [Microbacterium invictum]|uniref:ABC-2 type transport system permease protein n=1 Tax=Microbacterium invictum TaxID=515415 RepID=A0AA40VKU9_9MICO|nr:hypothetical protein [Microbacterium invictum]MBB4138811.1 ABC-2 type transport system permease protein [Microbacterium invictum]